MPRCKALVRGGSRRCKRKALKGSMFCSQCGGSFSSHLSPHNNNINRGISSQRLPLPNASRGPSNSETISPADRRRFNVRGLGIAYRNHIIRTLKEIPHTLIGVGTVEMSARSTAHPTIARNVGYRYALRPYMGVSGSIALVGMATEYHADLAEGQFPGTDESILI